MEVILHEVGKHGGGIIELVEERPLHRPVLAREGQRVRVAGWDLIHWRREERDYLASDGVRSPAKYGASALPFAPLMKKEAKEMYVATDQVRRGAKKREVGRGRCERRCKLSVMGDIDRMHWREKDLTFTCNQSSRDFEKEVLVGRFQSLR